MAQTHPMIESDHLLDVLRQCGDQLDTWISKSPANACLFIEDPAAAMQAASAPTDLSLDAMRELEAVLSDLVRKLDLPVPPHPKTGLCKAS